MKKTTKSALAVAGSVALVFGAVVSSEAQAAPKQVTLAFQDRKSTRLNSSHT